MVQFLIYVQELLSSWNAYSNIYRIFNCAHVVLAGDISTLYCPNYATRYPLQVRFILKPRNCVFHPAERAYQISVHASPTPLFSGIYIMHMYRYVGPLSHQSLSNTLSSPSPGVQFISVIPPSFCNLDRVFIFCIVHMERVLLFCKIRNCGLFCLS